MKRHIFIQADAAMKSAMDSKGWAVKCTVDRCRPLGCTKAWGFEKVLQPAAKRPVFPSCFQTFVRWRKALWSM